MLRLRPAYDPPATIVGRPEVVNRLASFFGIVVAAGILGFVMENVIFGARYSKALDGRRGGVPFLPVYAAGGAVLASVIPAVRPLAVPLRFAAYAGSLTAVEYGACQLDRGWGSRSWKYEEGFDSHGCVDLPHSIAWGALGVVMEQVVNAAGW